MMAADCGLPDHTELLNHFYAQTDRRYWAGRSRVVFELANAGDATSRQIIDDAADALTALTAQVADRLGIRGPVVLAGGQAVNQPVLQQAIRRRLAEHQITDVRVLSVDPVRGAVEIARQLLTRCVHEGTETRTKELS